MLIASSRSIYGEGQYLNKDNQVVYPRSRLDNDMLNGEFELLDEVTKQRLTLVATNEEADIHPISVYGMTKQYQEEMFMKIAPTIGIIPVAVRYQNVYGPGQSLSNPYTGILAVFSTRILNGNPIEIFEDGLESRDFVYIDDVVDATILAMFNTNADNQVFNVGTGVAIPVKYIAEKLIKLYDKSVEIKITGRYRVGDIRHNYADMNKIRAVLGFMPKVDFDAGLANFATWVKTQRIQNDDYEKSIAELKAKDLFKG
jgi:dTDP-L-rhamnose 4-epimerase